MSVGQDVFVGHQQRLRWSLLSPYVSLLEDWHVVAYRGHAARSDDVGGVRTQQPLQGHSVLIYFEVEITDVGSKSSIAVGLAREMYSGLHPLGTEKGSVAYHGDTGCLHLESRRDARSIGPSFTAGDIIGCGLCFPLKELFFTRNGDLLGAFPCPCKFWRSPLYPAVSMHSKGETVSLPQSLAFDVDSYTLDCEERLRNLYCSQSLENGWGEA